jgi:HK97 family phage major capsid protein
MQKEISFLKGKLSTMPYSEEFGLTHRTRGVSVGWKDSTQAKRFVQFFKAVATKDLATIKALNDGMAENTDGTIPPGEETGGIFVPFEFRPTILRIMEQYGQIRQYAQIVPMSRDEIQFPVYSGSWTNKAGAALSTPVYWVDEMDTISQTWPKFTTVTMKVAKLAALVPVSGELLQDSIIPIASLIATLVGEYFAKEEDRVGFTGTTAGGADKFNGCLTAAGKTVTGATTDLASITADDVLDMQMQLASGVANGGRYFMHRTVFNVLRKLKDKNDNYIYNPTGGPGNQIAQGPEGSLWGYPVTLVEAMPAYDGAAHVSTRYILFGNLKNYYFADKMQMSVASTDIVGFAAFMTHFRFIERIGMALPLPDTLVAWKTAAA